MPVETFIVARTAIEDVHAEDRALAGLLDEAGRDGWAETLRRTVVAALAGELAMARSDPMGRPARRPPAR
jgi:hypothetical protein